MRIGLLSDLHLNFLPKEGCWYPPQTDADVVVLAGDIHAHTHGLEWAAQAFPDKPVLYVVGNHEVYNSMLHGLMIEMKKRVAEFPNIHLLDNSSLVLNGVRFIGATLWTDFGLYGADKTFACIRAAKALMNDFSCIRFGSTGWMLPQDTVKLFLVSAEYIKEQLQLPFDGKTVVVTHHLPSMLSVADRFKQDPLTAAFASNLDHLVVQADAWIHGHTHDSFDYQLGKCRVICNPRGYPSRDGSFENQRGFNPSLVVEV